MLRQPGLTSDALLLTADSLDTWTDIPAAQDVARLMRVIAPCYAAVPLQAAVAPGVPQEDAERRVAEIYRVPPEHLEALSLAAERSHGAQSPAFRLLAALRFWSARVPA